MGWGKDQQGGRRERCQGGLGVTRVLAGREEGVGRDDFPSEEVLLSTWVSCKERLYSLLLHQVDSLQLVPYCQPVGLAVVHPSKQLYLEGTRREPLYYTIHLERGGEGEGERGGLDSPYK